MENRKTLTGYNHKDLLKDMLEWDVKVWSQAIYHWEKCGISNFSGRKCLEVGARNGGMSLWLALNGGETICSDLSCPGKNALDLHRKYGVEDRIKYEKIDATNIPYENEFDVVLFKSVLGGIGINNQKELQKKAVKEIYKSLKGGGVLLGAENLIASPAHQWLRKKYVRWAEQWRYISLDELFDMIRDYRYFDVVSFGFLGAFGRNELQRNILGCIDKLLMQKIVPLNWKYVVSIVAKK